MTDHSHPMPPLMRQISLTYRYAMRYRDQELADTGLNGCQTPYLLTLYRRPGISQEEMARQLGVNKSSVARQLAVLEEMGFVRREGAPGDRRTLLVYPTEKALSLQGRIRSVLKTWSELLTEDFTPEEKETLSLLMQRIAVKADAYMNGGDQPCGR